MAIDERTRELVYRALEPVIGEEAAAVLSRELPGSEVAMNQDLVAMNADLERLRDDMNRRFEQVDHRFELVEAAMRELRTELLAAFRGELVTAVSGQARMMLVGMIGTAVTIAVAVVAVAQIL